ncbi:MAG: hypothetical protein CMN78_05420 [Spirochaetales bacterium]|nr:hypothetical protein [Spirochaetales bacterium]
MIAKRDVLTLLRLFAIRKKSQTLSFPEFVTFSQKYAEKKGPENPSLASLASDTEIQLITQLEDLSGDNRCTINYEQGKIGTVVYPEFFPQLVKKKYKALNDDPEIPFPTVGGMELTLPSGVITDVNVRGEFVSIIEKSKEGESKLLRLIFPEGINSFLVPSDLVKSQLLRMCIAKLRLYLNTQKNASYMASKLKSVFPAREQQVSDMISRIITQSGQIIESITKPTDFTFSFWTNLANSIIREYREKVTKLEKEHSFCQAAYLLGYFNVYNKSLVRKQKDVKAAFGVLDRKLRQAPFVFTVSDISNFKDKNGLPLTKKYSSTQMHEFLEKKTTPGDDKSLPDILRIKTADTKEYFITKDVVIPLTAKKIQDASAEYRKQYIEEWMSYIEQVKKVKEMKSDEAFISQLDSRVRKAEPLLGALLSYELLYLLLQETKSGTEVSNRVSRILDTPHSRLIPMDEILRLNRRELFTQAKVNLPFWKSMPFLNRMLSFMGTMFTGSKKTKRKKGRAAASVDTSGAKLLGAHTVVGDSSEDIPSPKPADGRSRSSQTQALKNAMARLKIEFVGSSSLDESMGGLIDRWNMMFDPQAKANLVEDVNSLVRDFLRKLRRGFLVKPPDSRRIRTMAASLADNHAFDQIKRRDAFQRYIELYMIKTLSGK